MATVDQLQVKLMKKGKWCWHYGCWTSKVQKKLKKVKSPLRIKETKNTKSLLRLVETQIIVIKWHQRICGTMKVRRRQNSYSRTYFGSTSACNYLVTKPFCISCSPAIWIMLCKIDYSSVLSHSWRNDSTVPVASAQCYDLCLLELAVNVYSTLFTQ